MDLGHVNSRCMLGSLYTIIKTKVRNITGVLAVVKNWVLMTESLRCVEENVENRAPPEMTSEKVHLPHGWNGSSSNHKMYTNNKDVFSILELVSDQTISSTYLPSSSDSNIVFNCRKGVIVKMNETTNQFELDWIGTDAQEQLEIAEQTIHETDTQCMKLLFFRALNGIPTHDYTNIVNPPNLVRIHWAND